MRLHDCIHTRRTTLVSPAAGHCVLYSLVPVLTGQQKDVQTVGSDGDKLGHHRLDGHRDVGEGGAHEDRGAGLGRRAVSCHWRKG